MSTLTVDDLILDPERYHAVRRDRRAAIIELRRRRRVKLGDLIAIEFENAETLRYQAQEMVYVERVTEPAQAAAELAVYERLLPSARSLTATMLIELADQSRIRAELARLDGIHEAVSLELGGSISRGIDIPPPDEGPALHSVSVHFLRFDVEPQALREVGSAATARIVIDHPNYQAVAELSPDLLSTIASDITAVEAA